MITCLCVYAYSLILQLCFMFFYVLVFYVPLLIERLCFTSDILF